jgi:hypothetical protein
MLVHHHKIIFLLCAFVFYACQPKQDGAIQGSIVPAGASARITAMQNGNTVGTVPASAQDGTFKLVLAPGVYSITVAVPESPYPLAFSNIIVKPGETTTLAPIELTPSAGKASLSGRITPPRQNGEVKLIYEGKERAAARIDSEGKYEFKELPAGTYILRAHAPGHAEDAAQIVLTENQKREQNAMLFPIIPIDGVDWATGKIRAIGIGMPPQNAPNESVRRAMAQRAALADAQRNLLRTIEQIRIDEQQDVKTAMREKAFSTKIQGFLKGYTTVSERELAGGKIELVLELPLTGTAGLSRILTE